MRKKILIITIFIVLTGILAGILYYFYTSNEKNNKDEEQNNYEASRTSINDKSENTDNIDTIDNSKSNQNNSLNHNTNTNQSVKTIETTLSSFSTKIYTKDSARQNNINITCNSLNSCVVKNGQIFSFCNTVGQSTTSKGYKKADIFDKNGNKKKGLRWW